MKEDWKIWVIQHLGHTTAFVLDTIYEAVEVILVVGFLPIILGALPTYIVDRYMMTEDSLGKIGFVFICWVMGIFIAGGLSVLHDDLKARYKAFIQEYPPQKKEDEE